MRCSVRWARTSVPWCMYITRYKYSLKKNSFTVREKEKKGKGSLVRCNDQHLFHSPAAAAPTRCPKKQKKKKNYSNQTCGSGSSILGIPNFLFFACYFMCQCCTCRFFFSFFTWRFVPKKKKFWFYNYVRSISQRWRRKNVWWNGQGQMETELSGFVFSRLKGCHESSAGQARLIISYSLSNIGFLETCTQSTRHIYNVYISLSNVLTILTSEITKNQIPPTNLQAGPNRIFIRHRFCVCKQQQQQNHINNSPPPSH